MARQYEVERFYADEAALLDARRYRDWLALLADDIRYWMPVRRTRTTNELDGEFTRQGDMAFFDDDRKMLEIRVKRIESGYAWAEDPPSRTRHLVTNVRIVYDVEGTMTVESNFHLHRSRLNSEEDNWLGMRRDTLRRVEGKFLIASRHVFLEQTLLLSRNLSNFF